MAPRAAIVLWIALLGATVALSVLAARHETLPGDTDIIGWAQDQPFPGQALSDAIRAVTTTQVTVAVGAVLVGTLWLLGYRWHAAAIVVALAALLVLQTGVKEGVDRPRPPEPLVEHRAGFSSPSFPAGHVMSPTVLYLFVLYGALRLHLPASVRLAAAAWAALVLVFAAPPNVWLGVHWPSDVLGAWAWALVIDLSLVYALERRRAHRPAAGGGG